MEETLKQMLRNLYVLSYIYVALIAIFYPIKSEYFADWIPYVIYPTLVLSIITSAYDLLKLKRKQNDTPN